LPVKILVDAFGAVFSDVVMLSARDYHNIAVKADGSVWMWGANDQGQCGVGTTSDVDSPSPVVGLGPRVPLLLNLQKSLQAGSVDLSWSSTTGEYFTVEYAPDLATVFTGLQSNILATPNTNLVTVPMTNGAGYYRLRF